MSLQYKLTIALLTTTWMIAGIYVQYTSIIPISGNTPQGGINRAVHAEKHGRRVKNVRVRKGVPVASDGDAEVLTQVPGPDSRNPLWGKSQQ